MRFLLGILTIVLLGGCTSSPPWPGLVRDVSKKDYAQNEQQDASKTAVRLVRAYWALVMEDADIVQVNADHGVHILVYVDGFWIDPTTGDHAQSVDELGYTKVKNVPRKLVKNDTAYN